MNVICGCQIETSLRRCCSYLHAILKLRHDWTFGYEVEHPSFEGEWHWDDKGHEEDHLGHEEDEHLIDMLVSTLYSGSLQPICHRSVLTRL